MGKASLTRLLLTGHMYVRTCTRGFHVHGNAGLQSTGVCDMCFQSMITNHRCECELVAQHRSHRVWNNVGGFTRPSWQWVLA
jgi:hypothetical protein